MSIPCDLSLPSHIPSKESDPLLAISGAALERAQSFFRYQYIIEETQSFAFLLKATKALPFTDHLMYLVNTAIKYDQMKWEVFTIFKV